MNQAEELIKKVREGTDPSEILQEAGDAISGLKEFMKDASKRALALIKKAGGPSNLKIIHNDSLMRKVEKDYYSQARARVGGDVNASQLKDYAASTQNSRVMLIPYEGSRYLLIEQEYGENFFFKLKK